MVISVDEARARGINLPSDVDAAQGIIDEQEAWLTARIGPLTGMRTETFRVDGSHDATLYLARHTDSVEVTDGASDLTLDDDYLLGNGHVTRVFGSYGARWIGPTVDVTYEPSEDEVRRVLFGLVGLASVVSGPYDSETIGAYSYSRGSGSGSVPAQRAALADSLVPRRPATHTAHRVAP